MNRFNFKVILIIVMILLGLANNNYLRIMAKSQLNSFDVENYNCFIGGISISNLYIADSCSFSITKIQNCRINHLYSAPLESTLIIWHECLKADEDTLNYYPTWSDNLGLLAATSNDTIVIQPNLANWSSSNTNVVTIVDGHLHAVGPGIATIWANMPNAIGGMTFVRVTKPVRAPVFNDLPTSLTSPRNICAVKEMPVIIIRYLPTKDGIKLDAAHAPDFYELGNITLAALEQKLNEYDERVKFALEEGSRFRDYGQNIMLPYLGYRVVEMITVYEPTPRGKVHNYDIHGLPVFDIDLHSIFERFNLKHYINDIGVKEIWLWQYNSESGYTSYDPQINKPCNFRFAAESNMSSPVSPDISNSLQDTSDLPIYDKTYIVYGQNIWRSQAEVLHNHGHQIERMVPYINKIQTGNDRLFWRSFVGKNSTNEFITGRCGWTHMPPNTTTNYDYLNVSPILSDIKDWNPNGGIQTTVNVNTWGDIPYDWPGMNEFPQRIESQWYIFWQQSIPGYLNSIPYGSNFLTNWWEIIADWDLAINESFGIYDSNSSSPAYLYVEADICTGDSFLYNGINYSVEGNYEIHLKNSHGCDSLILLSINVIPTHYFILQESICKDSSYHIADTLFTTAGQHLIHLISNDGCDSLISLTLAFEIINTSVIIQNNTLISNQPGAMYQWYNCITGEDIPGATHRYYNVLTSGRYATRIKTIKGCNALSDCTSMQITGIEEMTLADKIVIYPNPGRDKISVFNGSKFSFSSIKIINLSGQEVGTITTIDNEYFDISFLDKGLYYLNIRINGKILIKKLIII